MHPMILEELRRRAVSGDVTSFITVWRTTTSAEAVTLPANSASNDFDIDWGDGTVEHITTTYPSHVYADPGDYTVKISGTCPGWYQANSGDKLKCIAVKQLGDVGLTGSLYGAFNGCANMTTFTVAPCVVTGVTDLRYFLATCSSLVSVDLNGIDTHGCKYFSSMFSGCSSLVSLDVSPLDTSSMTMCASMFRGMSSLLTLDVSSLDFSWVTSFSTLFYGCRSLQSITGVNDIFHSSVTSISYMFSSCLSLSGVDPSGWDISNVTNMSGFASNSQIMTTAVYDATLIAWDALSVQPSLSVSFGNCTYTAGGSAEAARSSLITNDLWTITDGGGV